jgi:hypothetical protein
MHDENAVNTSLYACARASVRASISSRMHDAGFSTSRVAVLGDLAFARVRELMGRYGVELVEVPAETQIPFSFWGEPEAGIRGLRLYARVDTPAHSLLHELAHVVCLTGARRTALVRDAGGDDEEECAVCYLQVVLASWLPDFGRERALADMDCWGYSFREGSARQWFCGDGADARAWLLEKDLIDADAAPTWRLRA